MPEHPHPKPRAHPHKAGMDRATARAAPASGEGVPDGAASEGAAPPPPALDAAAYIDLDVTSNYTFLHGASFPEELVQQAHAHGQPAIAVTDTNTLAGIVRAYSEAKDRGLHLIVGCRLVLSEPDGLTLLVYPTSRPAYARLSTLLTLGKRRAEKGQCRLTLDDLAAKADGLIAVLVPPDDPGLGGAGKLGGPGVLDSPFAAAAARARAVFAGDDLSLAIRRHHDGRDDEREAALVSLSRALGVPLVATNGVLYHHASRRPLQDALTCVRLGTTLDQAGYALQPHAERHLKPPDEMARLFPTLPAALRRSVDIARRAAAFSLGELRYEYPREVVPAGRTPMQHLRELTWAGAAERYPEGLTPELRATLEHELTLIDELHYAPYFLTVHDLVRFARGRGILCQGRGAAANSAVCFCLGVTSVDPARISLLFERFISRERREPPDIDIDFEHERREEVIQYIYAKYGRDRAALTAEVISYRGRSAVRDLGKALGLSLDRVDQLARTLDWWEGGVIAEDRLRELGLHPEDRTLRLLLHLCEQVQGFPRHLSQHVGGFVITDAPLCELVPIENAAMPNRTVIEWDKDDIDAMGMLKVDCLGLGMLTCIRKAFELVERHHDRPLTLATVPAEDPAVYDMVSRADTVGVFQIESRAQMSMLPRLRPRCFYDLVIEVAIVRPGPIQGKMVHPYLRRRNGEEPVSYPSEAVKAVLGRTLGVPLFQEQAMQLAIVAAGFTPGEADALRRAMAAWKRKGNLIHRFGAQLIAGMKARGYDAAFAEQCFAQIKGFSEYGFPESHAASFALLVYVSSWLKCHYPAAFAAALINAQPMGFYQPAQIVRDAAEHGVASRPVDVNASDFDCTLEPAAGGSPAIRLGMRLIRGLPEAEARRLVEERSRGGAYASVADLHRRTGLLVASLRTLARADAFAAMGLERRAALWAIQALRDEHLPLFEPAPGRPAADADPRDAEHLPVQAGHEAVRDDYAHVGLSLKAHPLSFIRPALDARATRGRAGRGGGITRAGDLADESRFPHKTPVRVAGLVLLRQRPSTASGIVFMTIEDETGTANLIIRPAIYERDRLAARHSAMVIAHGHVERKDAVVHVVVRRIERLHTGEREVAVRSRDFH